MTWELKPAREAFPAFAQEWDRLNRDIHDDHPMFDSRFVGPLLECFSQGGEQLCIHRNGVEVDAALILRPAGFGRWTLFLPSQAQAGALLLRDAGLLETLFGTLPGFAWSIELLAIDPQFSPDWSRLSLPHTVLSHSLTMTVACSGDFKAYWQTRPKKLAANLLRYQRRTEARNNAISLIVIDEPHEMRAAVARYGALESSGWKGKTGTAVSIDNAQGRFYENTLRDFAISRQAKVLELHIGEKLAASRLIIRHERMWIMLKTTYDESLADLAPGRQLLHKALEQAFAELQPGDVEFYTNATRDQAEWATSLRYIRHHQLYRGQLPAAMYHLAKTLRDSIFRRTANDKEEAGQKFDPVAVLRHTSTQLLPHDTSRLFDEFSRQNIESSPGWFDNLQRSVYPNDTVRYYTTELAGKPLSILPVRLVRNGLIRGVEALGNFYTSLYAPIIAPTSTSLDLLPLLDAASREHLDAHVMRFAPMDPDSPGYEALLTALRSSGWIPFRFFCFGNWFLKVDKSWPEYLKAREGRLRSTIKRMGRKFAVENGTLEIVTEPALIQSGIQAFNDVYALSWKKPEPYPEFIPGLIHWLAAEGKLRLGIARLAGKPVAAQLWIVSHGKASIFKLAYDESFAAFSPGTLLTAHLMEHVTDHDRVSEVDYLIGDDMHKQLWMSHRRERWGIVAYNPKTLIGLVLLLREILGREIRQGSEWIRAKLLTSAEATLTHPSGRRNPS